MPFGRITLSRKLVDNDIKIQTDAFTIVPLCIYSNDRRVFYSIVCLDKQPIVARKLSKSTSFAEKVGFLYLYRVYTYRKHNK